MTQRLRIVLADDHALVLEGLRSLVDAQPDMVVVGTATDGSQVMELLRTLKPEVVVLDLEMGTMSGLACLERIEQVSHHRFVPKFRCLHVVLHT